jgi:hypothetical protein
VVADEIPSKGWSGLMPGEVFFVILGVDAFLYFTLFFVLYCVFRSLYRKETGKFGNGSPFWTAVTEIGCLILMSVSFALLTFVWVSVERPYFRSPGEMLAGETRGFRTSNEVIPFIMGVDALVYCVLLFCGYHILQKFFRKKTAARIGE